MTRPAPYHSDALDRFAAQVDAILGALTGHYESLLGLIAAHREALRRADTGAVQACVEEQSRILQKIADQEEARARLIAAATDVISIPATARPLSLTDLAAHLPEPHRTRLPAAAAQLRELMQRVSREHNTVLSAARSLIAHMEGLLRQVGRQLSHAGTYSRRGYVEAGVTVTSALDLRT